MPRTPGQRAGLDPTSVLAAARAVVGRDGVRALSMRAVAREAGVAPNALYSHVRDKDDLVDLLLDDHLAALVPDEHEDPVAALGAMMTATYDLLVRSPDLVPLYLARQGARGPNARALGATMYADLARAGVEGPDADAAVRALIVHAIGSAAFVAPDAPLESDELRSGFLASLGWLLAGITGRMRG